MFSSFWNKIDEQNLATINSVDEILENPDVELETLLDIPDFTKECSKQNERLVSFLCNGKTVSKILNYLLVEPLSTDDENKKFKYPFKCNAIVTSSIPQFIEAVSTDPKNFEKIFSFLETPKVNSVLAGYFKTLIQELLMFNNSGLFEFILENPENNLNLFLNHIKNISISETLQKLCWGEFAKSDQNWIVGAGIIPKLIQKIKPESSFADKQAASNLLTNMVCESFNMLTKRKNSKSLLFQEFEKDENIELLMSNVLSGDKHSFEKTMNILIIYTFKMSELLLNSKRNSNVKQNKSCNDKQMTDDSDEIFSSNDVLPNEEIPPIISSLLLHLPFFCRILNSETSDETSENQNPPDRSSLELDADVNPEKTCLELLKHPKTLGGQKLKTLELSLTLMRFEIPILSSKLAELGVLKSVFSIFLEHPWHSHLHRIVRNLVITLVIGNSLVLKTNLFEETALLDIISKALEINNVYFNKMGNNIGFYGHIFEICEFIRDQSLVDETLKGFCNKSEVWEDLGKNFIEPVDKKFKFKIEERDYEKLKNDTLSYMDPVDFGDDLDI